MSAKRKTAPSRQQQQAEAQARRRRTPPGAGPRPPAQASPAVAAPVHKPAPSDVDHHYLDVAAVRIQEWLGRTPSLKFRRGASVLLTEATARDAWQGLEPAGTTWNTEAGDLAGVVSLVAVTPTSDDPDAADVDAVLLVAARAVAEAMRVKMPHCAIQAVSASGPSYVEAYAALESKRRRGDFLVDTPAPPNETVLAKPCDLCLQAPATSRGIRVIDRDRDLCTECAARFDAAGGTKGDWARRSPQPERSMQSAVAKAGFDIAGFPDDFLNMARAGGIAPDDAATQLALIFADGNRVGAFLTDVARLPANKRRPLKSEIVVAVEEATLTALARAVTTTCIKGPLASAATASRPPVLAHIAGGDDLMVSVPARLGWPFVRALLGTFDDELGATATSWDLPQKVGVPSMSAGVIFHHSTHPFSDVVSKATAQLKHAKREVDGKRASVAFVDLTADGDQPRAGRPVRELTWLEGNHLLLDRLAAVSPSHRQAIASLYGQSLAPQRPGPMRATAQASATRGSNSLITAQETAIEALARRVVDLGESALWEVAAGPGATGDDVRRALVDEADSSARERLGHYLDLARWWPDPTGSGSEQSSSSSGSGA